MRDRQAGFTLIELMVTVAVISILAAIAVPSFFGETRKATAYSEVQPMFNDLRVRIEQYLQEFGTYPPTIGETTLYPTTPSATPQALNPLPATWLAVRVRISGRDQVRCSYTWATGVANTNTNIGPIAAGDPSTTPPLGFGFIAPATDWFYLLAKCDMDGINDGSDSSFSWYFTSSVDPSIQRLYEGK
jgi:prepilin-type N-terminal cleavage/methylation domain-containing protein